MIESTDDSAHISVDIYRYIVDIRCSFHYRHHNRRHHHHHHRLRCLHQQNVRLLSTSLLPENSSLLPLLASASKFVAIVALYRLPVELIAVIASTVGFDRRRDLRASFRHHFGHHSRQPQQQIYRQQQQLETSGILHDRTRHRALGASAKQLIY